ncbi:hypothetical protein F4777DRAFT_111075 [Nemania sp. FL0916]|nr:hypothetical protein F4777DRAFT_111075 [Nemania sp. FL0916]
MPLKLLEVDQNTDFPALADCMFDSHEVPPQPFFQAFFPYNSSTSPSSSPAWSKTRAEAIEECGTRLYAWHTSDPTSYWQKVVDEENGRIAGAALWKICREDPFKGKEKEKGGGGGGKEVDWFPEGGGRRFVERFLEMYDGPRERRGRRPQVYLYILFTHPSYRRRGVAQTFLDWGMRKADEMGVEMFLDSTPIGKPLYEANGFHVVEETVIKPEPETGDPDDEWREAERKIGPSEWWLMWRPMHGVWEEGVSVRPWEGS